MWSIYAHLLNRIERSHYNVFDRRITISRLLRLLIAVRYWLSHQIRYRNRVSTAAAPSGE
jgi:phytoene/squalene synthetase